jgi:hypothetical protein
MPKHCSNTEQHWSNCAQFNVREDYTLSGDAREKSDFVDSLVVFPSLTFPPLFLGTLLTYFQIHWFFFKPGLICFQTSIVNIPIIVLLIQEFLHDFQK